MCVFFLNQARQVLQYQSYDTPEARMDSAVSAADLSSPAMSPEPEEQRAHLQLQADNSVLLKNVLSCKGRETEGKCGVEGYLALCHASWKM